MEWRELKPTSLDLWQAFYLRTSNVLRSMKILFLSTWFPYPLDTGARIRVHHLLKAIAKEGSVIQPTSKDFMLNYGLGTASSIQTALQALMDKELVFEEQGKYALNDIFLSRWLERY